MIFVNSYEETSSVILSLVLKVKKRPISKWLGVISFLPKGHKPRQFLEIWHPITLLMF